MSEGMRCPHCRAAVSVRPGRRGGLRCRLCGGPRVVVRDSRVVLSGSEVPHLVQARKDQRAAWLWLGATFVTGTLATFFFLLLTIGVLVFRPETTTTLLLFLLGTFPWLSAVIAHRRSRAAQQRADAATRQAQLSAARDVLTGSERAITAPKLAHVLELPIDVTERLLAELNVEDTVMSEITDAGEVTYRMAPLRLRVEGDGAEWEPRFDAATDVEEDAAHDAAPRVDHAGSARRSPHSGKQD